jgi:hypothetical protein
MGAGRFRTGGNGGNEGVRDKDNFVGCVLSDDEIVWGKTALPWGLFLAMQWCEEGDTTATSEAGDVAAGNRERSMIIRPLRI